MKRLRTDDVRSQEVPSTGVCSRDEGFTLVELMVVVLVIAILIAIAIPSFMGARQRAQDRTTQANLTTGLKAESAIAASGGGFTANAAALAAEEPSLDWTGTNPEDVHVVVGDVIPGDNAQVLLYTRSNTGTWFGLIQGIPICCFHDCRIHITIEAAKSALESDPARQRAQEIVEKIQYTEHFRVIWGVSRAGSSRLSTPRGPLS